MSLQTIKSTASFAHHGASLYTFGCSKRASTLGLESSFELEVENVKCVGTCSMMVLGGMVLVVRSPSPPPMIGSPAATLMSFRLRVDLI